MVFPVKPRSLKRSQNEESTANSEGGKLTTQITLLEDFINVSGVKKKRHFNFSVHPKRKIALQFLYYGWQFDGLVQQNNTENTVEKYLMDALLKTKLIEDTKCCDFSRCGRTDKGVSALKQVAAVVIS